MTRYFQSLGAGRPVNYGGQSFIFEPVETMGGSWSGVLAVDDESAASILAASGLEITAQQYDALKKKATGAQTARASVPSQMPPRMPPLPMVESASPAGARSGSSSEAKAEGEVAVPVAPAIELTTTRKAPPRDPLLEMVEPKRKRAA